MPYFPVRITHGTGPILSTGSQPRRINGAGLLVAVLLACWATLADAEHAHVESAIASREQVPAFEATVAIVGGRDGRDLLCTGVAIAPWAVVTARHCALINTTNAPTCGSETRHPLLVTAAGVVAPTADFRKVVAVHASDSCASDVAILELDEPLQAPVIAVEPRRAPSVNTNDVYSAFGYGATADERGSGAKRRIGDRRVRCVGADCSSATTSISATQWVGDGGTCAGDSGGPAIASDGRVVGIASRGDDACTVSVYESSVAWFDWAADVVRVAGAKPGFTVPTWALLSEASVTADDSATRSAGCSVREHQQRAPWSVFVMLVLLNCRLAARVVAGTMRTRGGL